MPDTTPNYHKYVLTCLQATKTEDIIRKTLMSVFGNWVRTRDLKDNDGQVPLMEYVMYSQQPVDEAKLTKMVAYLHEKLANTVITLTVEKLSAIYFIAGAMQPTKSDDDDEFEK